MSTDHEEPCGPSHKSFCLNGGICYVIPTMPSPFCRCIENYIGARCEEVFLPSSGIQTETDLFAAFVALAVLLGTLIVGSLYFLCRIFIKQTHTQSLQMKIKSVIQKSHNFQSRGFSLLFVLKFN
ncbi:pro-neuregulin-4, membrane-bound isoform isoform X2 [Saccopteryx leptura]|uniref:pro-neuregulin-4, membrane-bound isoform isoform X2 n=1 Tax=Saccopteryx leptura TaxID=249018 RepID=UPI00339CC912